jgi:large subunit ribosomal protein L6
MSRIGKKPVETKGAAVKVDGRTVTVQGKSATLSYTHEPQVSVRVDEDTNQVFVERHGDTRKAKAMHGLTRSLIFNMVQGVTEGFTENLEITGVGWNATVQGKKVALNIGYADTRYVDVPDGLTVEASKDGKIKISGADKQAVGQLAARIRSQRPPEPYNGRGIKYADETIVRKEGKAFGG